MHFMEWGRERQKVFELDRRTGPEEDLYHAFHATIAREGLLKRERRYWFKDAYAPSLPNRKVLDVAWTSFVSDGSILFAKR